MNARSPLRSSESLAARLRREIETAEADGVDRADMTLKLTLNDANRLRRDRSLAVSDISFLDGAMRFLGVTVVQGGVDESELQLG